VNKPLAARPRPADPGGFQARADGQQVEVRTYEGKMIRVVPSSVADQLVEAQLGDNLRHCVRLKLGIRWLPPRLDRLSGRPDLDQMRRRDPRKYAALWQRTLDAKTGKGALGRRSVDRSVLIGPTTKGSTGA